MSAQPSNPHDAYFRHVLARPADAASELRTALPDALARRINWSRLQLQPGSFVSTELRSRYSDLLYRTHLDGHAAYIYLPRNTDLGSDMLELVDDLRALSAGPNPISDLQAVMTYILIVGETTEEGLDPLIEQLGPRAKEAIVTTAERLRAEGRAEGRAATLIELLTVKFGSVPETTIRTIRAAAPDRVDTWLHRLITATTLDQVFA